MKHGRVTPLAAGRCPLGSSDKGESEKRYENLAETPQKRIFAIFQLAWFLRGFSVVLAWF